MDEGLSRLQICERLSLAPRTVDRYLSEIYYHDNQFLISPTAEQVVTQANVFRDQLTKQRQDVLSLLANNPDVEPMARIAAHNLVAEMGYACHKLDMETAALVASRFHFKDNKLVHEQKGLNLTLVKNDRQLGTHYIPSNTASAATTEQEEQPEQQQRQ